MAKKMNPSNLPWFPFYTAAWLGSTTVTGMTMTERGIYATLMAMCWQYGEIEWDATVLAKMLYIDRRTVVKWMEKYEHLTTTLQSSSTKRVLPKLQEFAETLGKSEVRQNTEERRIDKKRGEKRDGHASSVSETNSSPVVSESQADVSVPQRFNPLAFDGNINSSKSDATYDSPLVKKILYYHFKKTPSDFWAERVTSTKELARHIDTMHEQMLNDVGNDWETPTAKAKPTRIVGDPACDRCRGTGFVSIYNPTGSSYREPCTCEKHEEAAA